MSDEVTEPRGSESDPTRSIAPSAGAERRAVAPHIPSHIGRYRIVRILGEGGMGTVYEAQQESPKRSVALKVIRAGQVSAALLRRFEHESAVLGRLQHPGIAQVYEAGTVQDERGHPACEAEAASAWRRPVPFFAMEFIRGVPLTDYVTSKGLGTGERLDLVARICDAVYHAHQKGVIHRDLKPGNILVDESGQPKVLDFGVARATDSDIQHTTLQTDIGQLIGTVPYMSPEQVGGDPSELDTRSDVYALGVIAYELLAGRLPYDLRRRAIHEAARIIKEEEPTRLSSINRTLKGDVETIVARALEKEKTRRYQSAESFASDIRRYLKDEPITARPPSTWYQLRKFSRRNKGLVAGLAVAFVFLSAGLVLALVSRADAVHARNSERARADELKKVSDFQEKMLAQVDPTTAGVKLREDVNRRFAAALEKAKVPVAERAGLADEFRKDWARVNATDTALALIDATILKPSVKAIDEQFKDQPAVDAQLRQSLAIRYRDLGLYDAAFPLQDSALRTRRHVLGKDDLETLHSINEMGTLLQYQGKLAEAEKYTREGLEKSRRVMGEEHAETLAAINNMGALLSSQGKFAEAQACYREALEKSRRLFGEEHPETITSINNLAALLLEQGKLSEAEGYRREALEKSRRVLGEEHPVTLRSINNMGALLAAQGKYAEAEGYYREGVEKRRRVLGEEHPQTLTTISNLGFLLKDQGKYAEAEPFIREAMEKRRRVLGEDHPDTIAAINIMAGLLHEQGKLAEAEGYRREALEKSRRVLGEEHPETLTFINDMGSLLQDQGKLAEAEGYYRESLEKRRRVLGEEHQDTLIAINNMGVLLLIQGKFAEAEPYHREALEKRRRLLGEDHPDTLSSIVNLGGVFESLGKYDEALAHYREALEKYRRVLGEEHPTTLTIINNIAGVLVGEDKLPEAESYYREALEKRRRVLGDEHPATLTSIVLLGRVLQQQGRYQAAIDLLIPIEPAARRAFTNANARRLADLLSRLGRARVGLGYDAERFKLAEANQLEAHPIYIKTRGEKHKDTLACVQGLVDLYTAWDKAEPGKGYDAKAAQWKAKLVSDPAASKER